MGKVIGISLILVLILLLIGAIGYIVIDTYKERRAEREFMILQQGAQAGYEQAVVELVNQVVTCQPVPVWFGNESIDIIAVDCLDMGNLQPNFLSSNNELNAG